MCMEYNIPMTEVEWLAAGVTGVFLLQVNDSQRLKYAGVAFANLSTNEKQGRAALTNKKLAHSCLIFQVPIFIPFLVLLISVYLVIAPIIDKPQVITFKK
jgi:hypothetical protein